MVPGESASALVEQHLDLAHKAARLVYPRVREYVELEDLISLATVGLAEAAARFDPDAGASFRTFAWYRVHGAVIDGLRRSSHLPRRVWAKLIALRAAGDYLESAGQRASAARAQGAPAPTNAQALGEIQGALSAIRTMYVTSLAPLLGTEHEPPAAGERADETIDRVRLAARVEHAIAALPERERALIKMHYYDGKNLLEAGEVLGISKSWASRLHAQAVDRLRAALARDDGA